MAVDFNVTEIINILAESFFNGSSTLAGLAVMLAVFLVFLVILASVKAPVSYGLIPMMLVAIWFSYIGIMDSTVSFLIIIISVVLVANTARNLTARD